MLDWKILAASFAALLVVSAVLIGGSGDFLGGLGDWMGDSPLSGFLTAPVREPRQASLSIIHDFVEFQLEKSSFSAGSFKLTDFTGTVKANLTAGELSFIQKGTSFSMSLAYNETTLQGISIKKLSLPSASFTVSSNSLETSGQAASIEASDFSGQATFRRGSVLLEGNFTSIKGNGKEIA